MGLCKVPPVNTAIKTFKMIYDNLYTFENNIPAYAAAFMKKCSELKMNIMNKRKFVENGITKYVFTVNTPCGTGPGTYEITVENVVTNDHNITCTCPAFEYTEHGTCKHIGNLIIYICQIYDTDVYELSRLSVAGLHRFTRFYDLVVNNSKEISDLCLRIDPTIPTKQPIYTCAHTPAHRATTPPRVERVRECPPAPARVSHVNETIRSVPLTTPLNLNTTVYETSNVSAISIDMNSIVIRAFNNALTQRPELKTYITSVVEDKMEEVIINMFTLNVSH